MNFNWLWLKKLHFWDKKLPPTPVPKPTAKPVTKPAVKPVTKPSPPAVDNQPPLSCPPGETRCPQHGHYDSSNKECRDYQDQQRKLERNFAEVYKKSSTKVHD